MSKENPPLLTAEMARAYLEFWSGTGPDPDDDRGADETLYEALRALASGKTECRPAGAVPIDMLLFCPTCGKQHVDAPEPGTDWTNPPHKSHKCHGCGTTWRPAQVATNGVACIGTMGKADTWVPSMGAAGAVPADVEGLSDWRFKLDSEFAADPDADTVSYEAYARLRAFARQAVGTIEQYRAALRGRVVGGAAPGEREAFEAWARRQGFVLSTTPTGQYFHIAVMTAWAAWQARAALTSAAPPPVVPQVQELLRAARIYVERVAYSDARAGSERVEAKSLLSRIDAALGAAQRPDMAVGRAQGQHDATTRASRSTEVPSTEEKP